jgi:hypothetical protein
MSGEPVIAKTFHFVWSSIVMYAKSCMDSSMYLYTIVILLTCTSIIKGLQIEMILIYSVPQRSDI